MFGASGSKTRSPPGSPRIEPRKPGPGKTSHPVPGSIIPVFLESGQKERPFRSRMEEKDRRRRRSEGRDDVSHPLEKHPAELSSKRTSFSQESRVSSSSREEEERQKHGRDEHVDADGKKILMDARVQRIVSFVQHRELDIEKLRQSCWPGIPSWLRPTCWRLLCGYAPSSRESRMSVILRKRDEYREFISLYFDSLSNGTDEERAMFHQIHIDVLRTCPTLPLFQSQRIKLRLERILYIWALRHPGSGYVQGINDLVTPFFVTFLAEACGWCLREEKEKKNKKKQQQQSPDEDEVESIGSMDHGDDKDRDAESKEEEEDITSLSNSECLSDWVKELIIPSENADWICLTAETVRLPDAPLSDEDLNKVEADSFWCLTSFLDHILDHYTFAQPGIQRMVLKFEDIVKRLDSELYRHMRDAEVEFIQFGFRWMNCLLMRELPQEIIIRLWDTYLAQGSDFSVLHVYVCAALLITFRTELMSREFMELVMFLQSLPTGSWGESEIAMVLSQAYMWMTLFEACPKHLSDE